VRGVTAGHVVHVDDQQLVRCLEPKPFRESSLAGLRVQRRQLPRSKQEYKKRQKAFFHRVPVNTPVEIRNRIDRTTPAPSLTRVSTRQLPLASHESKSHNQKPAGRKKLGTTSDTYVFFPRKNEVEAKRHAVSRQA